MPNITKCMRDLTVTGTTASGLSRIGYLDVAEQLSRTNRKLFSQEYVYGIEDVAFTFLPSASYDTVQIQLSTAGDTYSVHNSWVKGKALWDQMNALVLEDNPSVAGKWADFKVFLDNTHRIMRVAGDNMNAITSEGIATQAGEWDYSQYTMPQHDVDAAGQPLPADDTFIHLLGADSGAPGAFASVGLVNAYALSRATIQPEAPNVPTAFGTSVFNLLTDSGSQEPELADIIRDDNDNPPYHEDNYPGAGINSIDAWLTSFASATSIAPNAMLPGFLAQCGLVKIVVNAYLNGDAVAAPDITLTCSVAPGMYKGVAAIPMGQ
jgi:hypothetical protein